MAAMTSCGILSRCVRIFWKYRILTCGRWPARQSRGQSKRTIWTVVFFGRAKAVGRINPSPSAVLLCQLSFAVLRVSSAPNRIHDQTWPDPIRAGPSAPWATTQRWERRRRSPLVFLFFLALRGLWTEETSSEMCEEWAVCSPFGLKPQDRPFTAKSPSRAHVTSAGSVEFVWKMLRAILLDNPNKKRGRIRIIRPLRIEKGKSLSLKLCCCFFPVRGGIFSYLKAQFVSLALQVMLCSFSCSRV